MGDLNVKIGHKQDDSEFVDGPTDMEIGMKGVNSHGISSGIESKKSLQRKWTWHLASAISKNKINFTNTIKKILLNK